MEKRFGALDSWRGICALLVATAHFGNGLDWRFADSTFIRNAYPAVDFFFVLSGFVIAHAYADRLRRPRDLCFFVIRRIGRLWPLHVAVLGAWVALQLVELAAHHSLNGASLHAPFTDSRTPLGLIGNLLLIHGLVPWYGAKWNPPSWSISIELWVCILFGVTCLVQERRRITIAIAIVVTSCLVLALSVDTMNVGAGLGVFRACFGFFLGSLVHHAYILSKQARMPMPTIVELVCVTLACLFVTFLAPSRWSLGAPFVFAVIVYVFAFEAGAPSRLLHCKALSNLGAWSYSIYLNHYLVMLIFTSAARKALKVFGWPAQEAPPILIGNHYLMDLVALAYLVVIVALSSFTYRHIENPARRYFNAIASKLWRTEAATSFG